MMKAEKAMPTTAGRSRPGAAAATEKETWERKKSSPPVQRDDLGFSTDLLLHEIPGTVVQLLISRLRKTPIRINVQ